MKKVTKTVRRQRCKKCDLLFSPSEMKDKLCPICYRQANTPKGGPQSEREKLNQTNREQLELAKSQREKEYEKIEKTCQEADEDKAARQELKAIETGKPTLVGRIREHSDRAANLISHLIIEARAGTGKTTTLIEGLKRMRGMESPFIPSPQQAAIWESMAYSKDAKTICFVAFNKAIAVELQKRVPQGCEAMTMHSMGFKAINRAFSGIKVNSYRVSDIISEILERDIRELRRLKPFIVKATEELVALCKQNLVGYDAKATDFGCDDTPFDEKDWPEALSDLASYYDVDLNGNSAEVFDLVPKVLERCKQVEKDKCIDFNDMIWLPIVLNLNVFQYDMLLVDESQDLNRCQQALARRAGRRLVLCGDPKQSIYGFAGADAESMARMYRELLDTPAGCQHLPLTVTRRCGKAIVKEANRIVPDFSAHETNPAGKISRMTMERQIKSGELVEFALKQADAVEQLAEQFRKLLKVNPEYDLEEGLAKSESNRSIHPLLKGVSSREINEEIKHPGTFRIVSNMHGSYHDTIDDFSMILCRCNAPLVSECFKFLRMGKKANIQGRDIGQGLITTIKKMSTYKSGECSPVAELIGDLDDWLYKEVTKENAKRNPSENRIIGLQDRHDCLFQFCQEAAVVSDVILKIESIFSDEDRGGVLLSSIHKAKGLEAKRVFILLPEGKFTPFPLDKLTAWERDQEMNIQYVAITRAIEELVWVTGTSKKGDKKR